MTDTASYCREVEAYLCRKNGGHLIRIVGPAFDLVKGWEQGGIPLSIVCAGIDRFVVRQQGKTPQRRRPARIEFCEADVLEAFDTWQRAVGAPALATRSPPEIAADTPQEATPRRGPSLASHIVRAATGLTQLRGERRLGITADEQLDRIAASLDALHARAGNARGAARTAIIDELASLDRELVEAARASLDAQALARLTTDAERELLPFRPRMDAQTYAQAQQAALEAQLRFSLGLPILRLG